MLFFVLRSFDRNRLGYLTFNDFLFGLQILSRPWNCCQHLKSNSCLCLQLKYNFLFRFYSTQPAKMFKMDLMKMAMDFKGLKKPKSVIQGNNMEQNPIRPSERSKQTNQSINPSKYPDNKGKLMIMSNNNPAINTKSQLFNKTNQKIITNDQREKLPDTLTLDDFIRFGSTGKLFHYIDISVTIEEFFDKVIKICCDYKDFLLPQWLPLEKGSLGQQLIAQNNASINNNFKCDLCKWIQFNIATHFISLSSQGEVYEVTRLDQIQAPDKDLEIISKHFKTDIQESEIYVLATDIINRITKFGLTIFHGIDMIESIQSLRQKQILTENLYFSSKEEAIISMIIIVNKAERILSNEPKVLNVNILKYSNKCFN